MFSSGADLRGGGGEGTPLPSGIQPPADPKGPPFVLFWDTHFWWRTLIFLKASLAPIYTNFEGGARAEKTRFFEKKNFQKVPKNAFFGLFFFKILSAAQKFWPKQGLFGAFGELRKQFDRPKKRSTKVSKFFWKSTPPPPREKPWSAPGSHYSFKPSIKVFLTACTVILSLWGAIICWGYFEKYPKIE